MDTDVQKLLELRQKLANRTIYQPSQTPIPQVAQVDVSPILQRIREYKSQVQLQPKQEPNFNFNTPESVPSGQATILPTRAKITQVFGQKSKYDVFSGNRNYGVDFAVKPGTPIALPKGEWEVVEAFAGAKRGYIGNKVNKGYGNSVLVRNRRTGEMLRFSHLNGVNVRPGMIVKGGTIIGASGATGNVTGPHLDLEYRTPTGQLADILRSPYARYLFGQGRPQRSTGGRGGGLETLGNIAKKVASYLGKTFIYNPEQKRLFPQSPYWSVKELNEDPNFRALVERKIKYDQLPEETKKKWNDLNMNLVMGMTSTPIFEGSVKYYRGTNGKFGSGVAVYGKGKYVTDKLENAKKYGENIESGIVSGKFIDLNKYKIEDDLKSILIDKASEFFGGNKKEAKKFVEDTISQVRKVGVDNELERVMKLVGAGDEDLSEVIANYFKKRGYDGLRYKSSPKIGEVPATNYVIYNPKTIKSNSPKILQTLEHIKTLQKRWDVSGPIARRQISKAISRAYQTLQELSKK